MYASSYFVVLFVSCLISMITASPLATVAKRGPSGPLNRRAQLSSREIEDLVIRDGHRPACSPAGTYGKDNGILLPKAGAKIMANEPFEVYYCSPTYHATRSVSYDVLAMNQDHRETGIVLKSGVQGLKAFNVTVPNDYYNQIAVFETQAGYYPGYQFAMFERNIETYGMSIE